MRLDDARKDGLDDRDSEAAQGCGRDQRISVLYDEARGGGEAKHGEGADDRAARAHDALQPWAGEGA